MPSSLQGFYTPLSWGGANMPVSPYTGQPDLAASLTPTISQPGISIPGGEGGGADLWGGMQNWLDTSGVLGKTLANGDKLQGWGSLGLGAAQGLLGGYLGLQQLGLAKDAAAQSKKQFDLNFAANKATTNARLEDQQRARVASNPGAYQSVGDYMSQYGVKG